MTPLAASLRGRNRSALCGSARVLFRAAAGPRRGFGHLVRCRSLARALGVRPLLSLRGPRHAVNVALRFGCDIACGSRGKLLRRLDLDLLVVDDPVASLAARWVCAARAAGIPVLTIHDLGIGCHAADLLIDGSITTPLDACRLPVASGPAFAILDPSLGSAARPFHARDGVVVALGGGPHAGAACAIAAEIARRAPGVPVHIVGGFVSSSPSRSLLRRCPPNVLWRGPSTNLAGLLGAAKVAVVGGGVSLYEACALGTAAVGVPVVAAQQPTVAAFVARGAALGHARVRVPPQRVAHAAVRLLQETRLRRFVSFTARRLVDGRGALRAASAAVRLIDAQGGRVAR